MISMPTPHNDRHLLNLRQTHPSGMFHSEVDAKRTPAVALVLLCSKMGLADRQSKCQAANLLYFLRNRNSRCSGFFFYPRGYCGESCRSELFHILAVKNNPWRERHGIRMESLARLLNLHRTRIGANHKLEAP